MKIKTIIFSSLLIFVITIPSLIIMGLFLYGMGVANTNPLSYFAPVPALVFAIIFSFIIKPATLKNALILGFSWTILAAGGLLASYLIGQRQNLQDTTELPERNIIVPVLYILGPLIYRACRIFRKKT